MWSCRCFPWLLMRGILTAWLLFLMGWMLRVVTKVVLGFFLFLFFSPSQSEYLHLFESIPLPGKILVPTVHIYLGKIQDRGQIWEGAVECWIPGGSAVRWEPQLGSLCSDCISVYAEWIETSRRSAGTPWQLAPGWLALFSLMCSRASSMFLTPWMGVWAVGPLAAFSFF